MGKCTLSLNFCSKAFFFCNYFFLNGHTPDPRGKVIVATYFSAPNNTRGKKCFKKSVVALKLFLKSNTAPPFLPNKSLETEDWASYCCKMSENRTTLFLLAIVWQSYLDKKRRLDWIFHTFNPASSTEALWKAESKAGKQGE